MQTVFYKYLALHKKLNLPGIGNFTIEDVPATLQLAGQQWQPPVSHIRFAPVVYPTNNHFYTFLSREWGVDKVIAIRRYKEEVEGLLDNLKALGMCELTDIGILSKTADGSLRFAAAEPSFAVFTPLPADRVLRKHSHHTVLVGGEEQVKEYIMPDDREEMVLEEEAAKDNWQRYALILAIVAVLLIIYYYAAQ